MTARMNEDNCENGVPICSKCHGIVKPDVVLYVRDDLTCITTEGNGTMGLAE